MAKRKKKDKISAEDVIPEYNLDSALKTSKITESTLHNLLQTVSEDTGIITSKQEKERLEPQLSHETKQKVKEDNVIEDKPVSERRFVENHTKVIISPSEPIQPKIIPEVTSTIAESIKKEPSFSKEGDIFIKLEEFFKEQFEGYSKRYDHWENSISSILSILRKMRKVTKKNSEDLVQSINNIYKTIQFNLELFKLKRDEVEKIAGINLQSMSNEFKKVLGLLELQVKEYQFKLLTDEFVRDYKSLM
jgi:hypothetical protein